MNKKMKTENYNVYEIETNKGTQVVLSPSATVCYLRFNCSRVSMLGRWSGRYENGQPIVATPESGE